MKFVAVRLAQFIVVLLAVTSFTYMLTFAANTPDDIIDKLLQQESGNQVRRDAIREDLNLDDPVVVRYGKWASDAVGGDLGISYSSQQPVTELISKRVPRTIALVVFAQFIALLLAVPAGIVAAWRANTWVDRGLSSSSIGLLAVPNYVAAIVLVYFFALKQDWFPAVAASSVRPSSLGDLLQIWSWDFRSLFLPSLALALGQVAVYMRLLRTDMIDTLQQEYITMAKAKGLRTRTILFRHALRPSSLSLVTSVGVNAGAAIGGTVIIEQYFGIQGVGELLVSSIFRGDVLVVLGVVAVVAAGFVVINLIIDLLYAVLDPRIRSV